MSEKSTMSDTTDTGDGAAEHDEGHDDPGYVGPATVVIGDAAAGGAAQEVEVQVDLRGVFQPIDGRFHWYGRVAANPELTELISGTRARVVLRTPTAEREGELSDPDLWGRFRITGESTPPFDIEVDLTETD